jgi:hypothetical protein
MAEIGRRASHDDTRSNDNRRYAYIIVFIDDTSMHQEYPSIIR